MKKEIGVSRIIDFRRCRFGYNEGAGGVRRPKTEFDLVGRAVHAAAAGTNANEAEAAVRRTMRHIAPEREDEAVQRMRRLADVALRMQSPGLKPEEKEKKIFWDDPVTGWRVYSKPDELFYFLEGRKRVLQVTDVKTAEFSTMRHKEEVFLHGLIAALVENYRFSIRLVVRLLGSESEKEFWYSSHETGRQVDKLRHTLRQIEDATTRGVFEPNPSFINCQRCKFRSRCAAGQEFMQRREQVRAGGLALPVVPAVAAVAPAAVCEVA